MIKFFRNIRRRMLSENRFSKYLLYAVGEIVLVVLGILIALSLNNWNSSRQEQTKELQLLAEMRQNLEADLSDCGYNIRFSQRMQRGCNAVLKHLEEGSPFQDSLKIHYGNVMGSTVLVANTSAYDHLKGIGFDLIENDSLRRSITRLYSERYPYLDKVEQGFFQHLQTVDIGPHIYEKIITDTLWVSGRPADLESLRKDRTFHGLMRMNSFMCQYMERLYTQFESDILALMEQLDAELEARQS